MACLGGTIRLALEAILAIAHPGVTDMSRVPSYPEVRQWAPSGDLWAPRLDYSSRGASWLGWTRAETRAEGLSRYVLHAEAIASVAVDPPPSWGGSTAEMVATLATIARHESGLWSVVETGELRGAAGEVCSVQIHPDSVGVTGYRLDDLVGGTDALERCYRAGAILLTRARCRCRSHGGKWFASAISSYGSGSRCDLVEQSWVTARLATYHRAWRGIGRGLHGDALIALELRIMSRPSAPSLNASALDAGPVGLPGPAPVPPAVVLWAGPAGARSSGAKRR